MSGVLNYIGFDLVSFLHAAAMLSVAFVLGGLIGFERQYRQRTAGLRTNVLVAVGAAAFVDLGMHVAGTDGEARVISYIVSGIGFLGAGVIMKEGTQVRGINTAATLWASAAVGAFAGAGQLAEAVLVAIFVLSGNTLLRPVVQYVSRLPINAEGTEALYRVHVVVRTEAAPAARDLLNEELSFHHYPIREIEILSEGDDVVELAAVLVPSTARPQDLNAVTTHLQHHAIIESATWTVSTES